MVDTDSSQKLSSTESQKARYSFGRFLFDAEKLELRSDDKLVPLKHQPARLLKVLLENSPDTVLRSTIYKSLWDNGTTVEFDQNLNACVRQLRSVLGDSATKPGFIETLPKRGYRFVAAVKKHQPGRRRKRWIWGVSAALVSIATVAVFVAADFFRTDDVASTAARIYVSPIAIESGATDETGSLFQYGLRLGVVDRLTRLNNDSLIAVNGESLWVDDRLQQLDKDVDYRLTISIDKEMGDFRANAKLLKAGLSEFHAAKVFHFEKVDAKGLAEVSQDIALWTAINLGSAVPVSQISELDYSPEYYAAIVKSKRARQLGNREAIKESLEWAEKALRISPASGEAKGAIAIALVVLAAEGTDFPTNSTYARAVAYANEIRTTVGPTVESELARGFVALYHEWDLLKAEQAFNLALELAPGDALVQAWRAGLLAAQGKTVEAAEAADLAVQLDPLSMSIVADRCWYSNAAGNYEEAVLACRWALELAPERNWSAIGLIAALEKLGRQEEALEIFAPMVVALAEKESAALKQGSPDLELPDLQSAHCASADWLSFRAERGEFPLFDLAAFNAQCGRFEKSAELLRKALQDGESGILFFKIDPRFERFRDSEVANSLNISIRPRRGEG